MSSTAPLVSAVIQAVQGGLSRWVEDTLAQAGLQRLPVVQGLPAPALSRPAVLLTAARLGPEGAQAHRLSPELLLRAGVLGPMPRTPVPFEWSSAAALLADGLDLLGLAGEPPEHLPPRVDQLTPRLRAWLQAQHAADPPERPDDPASVGWILERPDGAVAHLPSMVWMPGTTAVVHLLAAGLPGTEAHVDTLLAGLVCLLAGVHDTEGFDLAAPPSPARLACAAFARALAGDLRESGHEVHSARRQVTGDEVHQLGDRLDELAQVLERDQVVPVRVELAGELSAGEHAALVQAAGEPVVGAFGLRLAVRVGEQLRFGRVPPDDVLRPLYPVRIPGRGD